jgi:hypothetical protein
MIIMAYRQRWRWRIIADQTLGGLLTPRRAFQPSPLLWCARNRAASQRRVCGKSDTSAPAQAQAMATTPDGRRP